MKGRKSKRQMRREYEAFSANGKYAGMREEPVDRAVKNAGEGRRASVFKKPAFWAAIAGALIVCALGVFFFKKREVKPARCYCVLSDGSMLRVSISDAFEREVGSMLSQKKLKKGGVEKGDYKLISGGRELDYSSSKGLVSDREKGLSAVLGESGRKRLNELLGVGGVTEYGSPEGSGYRIRPLLCVTEGDDPRIELELICSKSTHIPYYAWIARLDENGEPVEDVIVNGLQVPYGYLVAEKCGRAVFHLNKSFIEKPGEYCLFMYEDYANNGAEDFQALSFVTGPSPRSVRFTVGGGSADPSAELIRDGYILTELYPELGRLDKDEGVNAYITEASPSWFLCVLLPKTEEFDPFKSFQMNRLTLSEARAALEYRGIPRGKVAVSTFTDPSSSYFSPSLSMQPPDYFEKLLFGEEETEPGPAADAKNGPKAYSGNANARLTVVAWDLNSGACFKEGYSADSIGLTADGTSRPFIAVLWENTGSEALTFGGALALEYFGSGDKAENVSGAKITTLVQNVMLKGGSAVEIYYLDGFDLTRHGTYLLRIGGDSGTRSPYFVEFTMPEGA